MQRDEPLRKIRTGRVDASRGKETGVGERVGRLDGRAGEVAEGLRWG